MEQKLKKRCDVNQQHRTTILSGVHEKVKKKKQNWLSAVCIHLQLSISPDSSQGTFILSLLSGTVTVSTPEYL